SVICGPIGCAVDFVCRLLHLEIILPKESLRTALCNKAVYLSQEHKLKMQYFAIAIRLIYKIFHLNHLL
ncbi:hypothetical protein ABLU12_15070, partial [Acinetobacter indicus]